jgi:hypothetical protein
MGHAGYYGFRPAEVAAALRHLVGLTHVVIEDRETVMRAIACAAEDWNSPTLFITRVTDRANAWPPSMTGSSSAG